MAQNDNASFSFRNGLHILFQKSFDADIIRLISISQIGYSKQPAARAVSCCTSEYIILSFLLLSAIKEVTILLCASATEGTPEVLYIHYCF